MRPQPLTSVSNKLVLQEAQNDHRPSSPATNCQRIGLKHYICIYSVRNAAGFFSVCIIRSVRLCQISHIKMFSFYKQTFEVVKHVSKPKFYKILHIVRINEVSCNFSYGNTYVTNVPPSTDNIPRT